MNLIAYLKAHGVHYDFVVKSTTHHAADASRATGIPLSRIVKSIVFAAPDGSLILAVVRADHMVSRHKLAASAGLRRVETAPDSLAEKATGYPTGGIPPVGHRRRLPVYVDSAVAGTERVWCGGGTRTKLVELSTADIVSLSGATVCDIAVDASQASEKP